MRVTEARDEVLDVMREGINGGLMSVVMSVEAWQHDSVMLQLTDGTMITLRVTEIKDGETGLVHQTWYTGTYVGPLPRERNT